MTSTELLGAAVSAAHHIHGRPLGDGAEDRRDVLERIVEATGIPTQELNQAIAQAPIDVAPLANGQQDPYDYLRDLAGKSPDHHRAP